MTKVNIITTTLPKTYGGRTKSLLQRALLLNLSGVDVRLVTTNYRENYTAIYQDYYEKHNVLANTTFDNIYDHYQSQLTGESVDWRDYLAQQVGDIAGHTLVKRSEKFGREYYYRNGIPKFMIKYHEPGKVHYFATYVDYHFEPTKFFFVNEQGYVHKIDHKDDNLDIIKQEFVASSGTTYVTRHLNSQGSVTKIKLVGSEQEVVTFDNERDFFAYYYAEIFTENDVVINDARALDYSLLKTNVKKRIFQLHNPHVDNPSVAIDTWKGSYKTLLTAPLDDSTAVVTLTEQQKRDIIAKRSELESHLVVIPHSTHERELIYPKLGNRFVMVLRLHPQKNIADAIQAFAIFHKNHPEYELDIYGEGELEDVLKQQVVALGLSNSVHFKGRTDDTDRAYQEADALIVSSEFEGFGLNVLEAIANGTPVITYPVKYGPTDIIDEKSGYVASERTPDALAAQMDNYVKAPKLREDVIERSKQFSEKHFVQKWLEIIG